MKICVLLALASIFACRTTSSNESSVESSSSKKADLIWFKEIPSKQYNFMYLCFHMKNGKKDGLVLMTSPAKTYLAILSQKETRTLYAGVEEVNWNYVVSRADSHFQAVSGSTSFKIKEISKIDHAVRPYDQTDDRKLVFEKLPGTTSDQIITKFDPEKTGTCE